MKTEIIKIDSDLHGRDQAMRAARKFASYNDITGKGAMHLRLLTEETISMVHGILEDFTGDLWLESEETKTGMICRICLSADKQANKVQEAHILSVSTSGKNESAKGVMGKIREMFRRSLQAESSADEEKLRSMADAWMDGGIPGADYAPSDSKYWSLQLYKKNLEKGSSEEWDELEKSIVAKLADDVKVWLNPDSTVIVVEKIF